MYYRVGETLEESTDESASFSNETNTATMVENDGNIEKLASAENDNDVLASFSNEIRTTSMVENERNVEAEKNDVDSSEIGGLKPKQ